MFYSLVLLLFAAVGNGFSAYTNCVLHNYPYCLINSLVCIFCFTQIQNSLIIWRINERTR